MNFKFNRKPLKEKIYKWYVCGYYDINARAVEDNLTTNDVEEAKDFAWELVNRGDFVIVKNMHNGKSAIVNEDDVFDDVSEYLNDIFRSIDGRTNESLKEDTNEKMVIYTQMGEYCVTPKSNYGGRMQNSRKVHHMKDFESAREVMDYWNKYFHTTDDDFIIINESLKEDISDYEIDKVYKKLSKLNKVDFGALEDEYLETKPSVKDAVYKFYGTILNTKRYCKDFVEWAKEEKGIDLKGLPCKESYRRR